MGTSFSLKLGAACLVLPRVHFMIFVVFFCVLRDVMRSHTWKPE